MTSEGDRRYRELEGRREERKRKGAIYLDAGYTCMDDA
jgi:hypothetical protein